MVALSKNGKPLGRPKGTPNKAPAPAVDPTAVAKALQSFKNRYDAAGMGRRIASWNPPSAGPNNVLEGVQRIRNRSRDTRRNDWAGESVIQKWSTNMVGIGITPRFKRIKSVTRRQEIMDLFLDFAKNIDADGVLDVFGMQTLVVETWFDGGECFARRRNRFPDEFKVPVQVQLLEPEMVPDDLNTNSFKLLPQGNYIRQGVEFNKRGRRVAYWVYKTHPQDKSSNDIVYEQDMFVRVAASEITHIFKPKRPGQIRGVSLLAPVLTHLRNLGDYKDTVLERQKIANLFVMFIKRTLPTLDPTNPLYGALSGLEQAIAPSGEPLVPLAPGLIQELEDGQSVDFANPPEAGTTYSDYVRTEQMGTASGTGLPYELFAGDIKDISDRTLRVIINEFRRLASQYQWQIIIPMFCQPVIDWFADACVLAGHITLEEAELVRRVEHAPHGWEYIHPVQDIQGKVMAMEAGVVSRSAVIGERGDDRDQVDQEREDDKASEDAHGLTPVEVDPNAEPGDDEQDQRDDQERRQAQAFMQEMREWRIKADARAAAPMPAPPAPKIEVHAHIPATQVAVTNNVEPTPVQVQNSIEPTPVVVNNSVEVPPAQVSVTNNVEPTPVTIHNEVQPTEVKVELPVRQTESSVKRDALGNIINVTQVEKTVQE